MDNSAPRFVESAADPLRAPHAVRASAVLAALDADAAGLSADEATRRLERHGRNELPDAPGRHPLLRFLSHFNSALIYLLLAAAFGAAVLGHGVDAAVIAAVVLVNAVVGHVQEGKAEAALAAIRRMIAPQAHVLRQGHREAIAVADLVPGDIVLLEAGDRVPADLRLLKARGLLIDEALLTGESVAAEKAEAPVVSEAPLGDRRGMAYAGAMVAAGQGTGVVVATGVGTEIGRISALLGGVAPVTTPLLRQIDRFGRRFTWVMLATGLPIFIFAVAVRGYGWGDALMAVVALAVGAVPEGLPAVITITLAIGVQRMAARNAVIRHLPAVEALGATSVICSDKTGTLTRNEMTARRVIVADGERVTTGSGYAPEGDPLFPDEGRIVGHETLLWLVRAGLLCNDAHLRFFEDAWHVVGDPMEGALVTLAEKAGLDHEAVRSQWARLDEIPFDAQHRFMATLNRAADGGTWVFVKGAPERLLQMCRTQAGEDGEMLLDRPFWTQRIADAAVEGERVLGFAMKPASGAVPRLTFDDVEDGLTFLGIVGFIDPPREEAVRAIAECRAAGIRVKMITGDHIATASAIARQLGLSPAPQSMTGGDLDGLDDAKLTKAVQETDVFARTSPEHKLRIVRALQSQGLVVAMTGDGVNDAPSLKAADVGIAMGRKGTEAAKEASQMVLLDDNFASIVAAVHEGRTVYENIRKVIAWTLPTNGGQVMALLVAILFNLTLPVTPVQILWMNMITAVTLGLSLAFEPPEPDVMRRLPRPASAPLLSPFLVWRIVSVSLIFAVCALGVFFHARGRGLDEEAARTLTVNMIVVLQVFYLFNVRYLHMTSLTWRGALGTAPVLLALAAVILAQLAFTYAPFMQSLFQTRAVSLWDGALVIAIGAAVMVLLEAEKLVLRRLGWTAI